MIRLELTLLLVIMTSSILMISHEQKKELRHFFRPSKSITLTQFQVALKTIKKEDKDHLALWHSMLTGNTRSLSKNYKTKYQELGLSHVFTPSGFHLSALLSPLRLFVPSKFSPYILVIITLLIFQLPGQEALKRMGIVKVFRAFIGTKGSFYLAMLVCLFLGQLNSSPLSFIFSLFFLGIIYSELKGIALIIWFFIGQLLITSLSGGSISFLNIIFSPIANLGLTLITPFLFLLSFPLGELQLKTGIFIIKQYDALLEFFYKVIQNFPQVEVHIFTLILLFFILWRKSLYFLVGVALFSTSLNLERATPHRISRYYFVPTGEIIKTVNRDDQQIIYFSDGICRVRLRMGIWEKRCSPKRAPRKRSIKKLSYL